MLRSLHVKNLALIDEIEVEFGEGLNILTGETGAGKSIILGSVNLALGGRYTRDIIRDGADYGFVELTFEIRDPGQIERLKALDVFPEEGMVVLSRRLMEGRSVSRINGETVTMGLLREVSAPSKATMASSTASWRPSAISITISSSAESTILLVFSAWGQMGVITIMDAVGSTIGPPADRLYAVEPVGVEMITPSAS